MYFKAPHLQKEFNSTHPSLQARVKNFDEWLVSQVMAQAVITHVLRTPSTQEEFYWRDVARKQNLPESIARSIARRKFSWHLVGAAVDIRDTVYAPSQKLEIKEFFKKTCDPAQWEFYEHDVGQGSHFHLGIKDDVWRNEWKGIFNDPG